MTDVHDDTLEPSTSETDEVIDGVTEDYSFEDIKLDRPAKNFVAEITRKSSDQVKEVLAGIPAAIEAAVTAAMEKTKSPAPVEQKTGLEAYSVDQLKQHAETLEVSDPMRQKISEHVQERIIHDRVASEVGAFTRDQRLQMDRTEWANRAKTRYPDLENPNSDFYKKVEAELKSMDASIASINPRSAYDAANAVAQAEGIRPTVRKSVPKPSATKGSSKPAETPDGEGPSDAEIAAMEAKLQHAMPKGKKFNRDNIRDRQKHYSDPNVLRHHLKG